MHAIDVGWTFPDLISLCGPEPGWSCGPYRPSGGSLDLPGGWACERTDWEQDWIDLGGEG